MERVRLVYSPGEINRNTRIQLPSSKSISNRILLLKHLTGYPRRVSNLSDSDDTQVLETCLQQVATLKEDAGSLHEIDAGHAGTAYRFLTALLAFTTGKWHLNGSGRMQERPIGHLVEALRRLGANISYSGKEGFPPLILRESIMNEAEPEIDISVSSQFASALLMVLATQGQALTLRLSGSPVSMPYLDMSIAVMNSLGMRVERRGMIVHILSGNACLDHYTIEPDWSSAAFFYELCALIPGSSFLLEDLHDDSIQGDAALAELFKAFEISSESRPDGILIRNEGLTKITSFSADLTNTPDLLPALACTCAASGINGDFSGIAHLRHKESDRIDALSRELAKFGIETQAGPDNLRITGRAKGKGQILDTHQDHRLAMALAPLALTCGEISLLNPSVVSKSFPRYWKELASISGLDIQIIA
jgi:3-phosphoshikimate 1-carboxyvinyltransferase